jgi:hypothetical protein
MKKIYLFMAVAIIAFASCQKQPYITPTSPLTKTAALTLTLQPSDYQLLPSSDYPYTQLSFNSTADADNYIPLILAAKESTNLNNGSTASVTYALATPTVKVADSLYADVTYTVTSADYKSAGSYYGDFSASQVLNFLALKYPNPAPNQLVVLSYVLYTNTDTNVTNSFLYINGAWQLIYQVTPAEYAEAGEGKYDQFDAADLPKLAGEFNFFLKNDISIADTAKAGDIDYVSYSYYASGNYQKVMALTYDGSNWGVITTQATGSFLLKGGSWVPVLPVPTITHTLTAADITLIVNSTDGTSAERTNLGKYGDFSGWATADLDAAFILVLTADYPTPVAGDNYNVVYLNYTGGADVPTTITFVWSGTAWAAK